MKLQKKLSTYEALLAPVIINAGYECVDITFEKNGKNWVLTAFIGSEEGISLKDCEKISRLLSEYLDEKDPIEQSYLLEVSSPGLERPLKKESDFKSSINKKIVVNFFTPINGKKEIEGILRGFDDDSIRIELFEDEEKPEEVVNFELIAKVALKIDF